MPVTAVREELDGVGEQGEVGEVGEVDGMITMEDGIREEGYEGEGSEESEKQTVRGSKDRGWRCEMDRYTWETCE